MSVSMRMEITQNIMFLHYISFYTSFVLMDKQAEKFTTNLPHFYLHTLPPLHPPSTLHESPLKVFNFVMLFKRGFKSLWPHLKALMNQNSPVSGVCKALRLSGHRNLNAHSITRLLHHYCFFFKISNIPMQASTMYLSLS